MPGAYFVNIVTRQRGCLFGKVTDGEMRLNRIGEMVADAWNWLEEQYPHVMLDEYIVMPDHLHGIIVINKYGTGADKARIQTKPLGQLVGAFKTVTTKRFNLEIDAAGRPLWQRNYWERIIRNERELNLAREYIRNNPFQLKAGK